jgi:hypothetical protein
VRRGSGARLPLVWPEAETEERCARSKQARIADEDQFARPVGERRGQGEIGTDAGGFAGRDDETPGAQGFRIST